MKKLITALIIAVMLFGLPACADWNFIPLIPLNNALDQLCKQSKNAALEDLLSDPDEQKRIEYYGGTVTINDLYVSDMYYSIVGNLNDGICFKYTFRVKEKEGYALGWSAINPLGSYNQTRWYTHGVVFNSDGEFRFAQISAYDAPDVNSNQWIKMTKYDEVECYNTAVEYFKAQKWRNPSSVEIQDYTISGYGTTEEMSATFIYDIEYTAQNGFGGYNRSHYYITVDSMTNTVLSAISL